MDISNVGASGGYQYQPKTTSNLQEEIKNTSDSDKRDLGVIIEISKANTRSADVIGNGSAEDSKRGAWKIWQYSA